MSPAAVRLVLPLPPDFSNARRHWRVQLAAKKAYWEQLNLLLAARQIEAPPRVPIRRARVTATLYVWSVLDLDNAFARLKWALDWLVGHGYIADDNPRVLRWEHTPRQIVDRQNRRVELVLTPLAEARTT